MHQVLSAAGFEPDSSSDETSTSKDTIYIPRGTKPVKEEGHQFFVNHEAGWQPHWEHWYNGEAVHSDVDDHGNMHPEYEGLEPHEQLTHYFNKLRSTKRIETAATPMPRMGVSVGKAGGLAKSLNTGAKATTPKLGGSIPKLGSAGSSFAENLINKVVAGQDPLKVLASHFGEDLAHDIERQDSVVSPKGSRATDAMIQPGMHIGIRGPVHNGMHTIDTVQNGLVSMKCQDGRMVTIPLSDLDDHEVVHTTEFV